MSDIAVEHDKQSEEYQIAEYSENIDCDEKILRDDDFGDVPLLYNKTIEILKKRLKKSIDSPSRKKINESPRVSLLASKGNMKSI